MMLAIYALAAVSGCVDAPSSQRVTAKQDLLGKSESALVACAGPPRTVSSQHGVRVLMYEKEGDLLERSFTGSKSSHPAGVVHTCRAIVTVENDLVTEVQYQVVPESTASHQHCEEIFQRCEP
jgi:hypothetical protein